MYAEELANKINQLKYTGPNKSEHYAYERAKSDVIAIVMAELPATPMTKARESRKKNEEE
jgi:hypothetical protein